MAAYAEFIGCECSFRSAIGVATSHNDRLLWRSTIPDCVIQDCQEEDQEVGRAQPQLHSGTKKSQSCTSTLALHSTVG